MKDKTVRLSEVKSTGIIFLCFLLTSTGWLSWSSHMRTQFPAGAVDALSMVVGYLLQAAGIGIFAAALKRRPRQCRRFAIASLALHMLFAVPAVVSPYRAGTLIFGMLLNLVCGVVAGYYLYDLSKNTEKAHRASVFGIGYGLSILASWLLSLIGGGSVYYSEKVLLVCLALSVLAAAIIARNDNSEKAAGEATGENAPASGRPLQKKTILLLCALVFFFSLVNSSGFAFPSADIGRTVNVEFSRLVYAAGLVIAGFATDKNRKYGSVCALTALMIPFVILALRAETFSAVIFWALSYFTFGFYSVYRIILFSDIASEKKLFFLSGFGLMAGRIGDALGEAFCLMAGGRLILLICVTALLFVAAVALFFKTYQFLYVPEDARRLSEQERFYQFALQHDLSAREQDVLRLLLEKKTNGEIAGALFISENTVKFHIRNLLQKTGCKSRGDLISVYQSSFSGQSYTV